jgi:pimeloyl-ACP methyl ester carboxylesterase
VKIHTLNGKPAVRLLAVLTFALAAQPTTANMPSKPAMVTLGTGSRVAAWTFPGNGKTRQTPVIFLHGGPGGFTTTGVIDKGAALRNAGFTTVYFDQAGDGQSERIPATQYTLDRAVNDVEALRIALKVERIILWGSSYGADLAVLYERRFPSRVAALIFSSPGSFPGTRPKYDYSPTDDRNVEPSNALNDAARQIDRQGGAAEATLSQEAAGRLFDAEMNAQALDGRMICKGSAAPPPSGVTGGNLFANRMLLKELKRLKLTIGRVPARPAITIRGACDFVPFANARKYQTTYGGALVTIEKAGHGLRENQVDLESALRQFATGPLAAIE